MYKQGRKTNCNVRREQNFYMDYIIRFLQSITFFTRNNKVQYNFEP